MAVKCADIIGSLPKNLQKFRLYRGKSVLNFLLGDLKCIQRYMVELLTIAVQRGISVSMHIRKDISHNLGYVDLRRDSGKNGGVGNLSKI